MASGTIQIPLNGRQYFTVTGGPFRQCPKTMSGVKMAAEINALCAVDIPTEDFQTPPVQVLKKGLVDAVGLVLDGEPVYVGCMGGLGRTGLFLAVLAKAFDVESPVEYVRKYYNGHAVETAKQYDFVSTFQITEEIKMMIANKRRWSWLRFWKKNLTRMPA